MPNIRKDILTYQMPPNPGTFLSIEKAVTAGLLSLGPPT